MSEGNGNMKESLNLPKRKELEIKKISIKFPFVLMDGPVLIQNN